MASLIQLTRRTAALLLVASLAACGGGGGSSDSGGGSTGGGGGSTGGGSGGETGGGGGETGGGETGGGGTGAQAVTGTYQLKPGASSHAQMLADANAMGASSYVLVSSFAGEMTGTTTEIGDFYLSDTAHAGRKFSYVNPAATGTMNDFLTQLNQQGSSGYMYKSGAVFGDVTDIRNVYVKDNSRSDQFSYRTVTPVATTAQAFFNELNEQGKAGYRYLGPQIIGTQSFSLYAKRNDNVTYEYQVNSVNNTWSAADNASLQNLLTAKGAEGWFIRGTEGLGDPLNMSFVDVYEKSSAQSGAIEYLVEPSKLSVGLQSQLDSMNANAAKGFFLFSQTGTGDGKFSNISVKNSVWMIHPLAGVSFP